MIEYKNRSGLKINVFLDKKKAGEIKFVKGGCQYFSKGSKTGGEIFATLWEVKKLLEK